MVITYLGHAGFCVETQHEIIVCDPWLSETGAFDSAWFQYPCNHHLAKTVIKTFASSTKKRWVYISHEHQDHFDIDFLKRLDCIDFEYLIPSFTRKALHESIANFSKNKVTICADAETIPLKNGYVKLYIEDSDLNRDSAILINEGGQIFFNINDCKLHDRLKCIAEQEGKINVFTCQFSGATWHPTCYDYSESEYERISKSKRDSKFEATAKAIQILDPDIYIPSAGPACFLDPELLSINFQKVNIFPINKDLLSFFEEKYPAIYGNTIDLYPGDTFWPDTNVAIKSENDPLAKNGFEEYILVYAKRYQSYFEHRKEENAVGKELFKELLLKAFRDKLSRFTSNQKIERPLFIQLADNLTTILKIDFKQNSVAFVNEMPEKSFYLLQVASYNLMPVLEKRITWEEFALTFRLKLNREPDVYQVLMQGFLILESEDLERFCGHIASLEKNNERIKIELGGEFYTINKFCPHQGADLSAGWAEEGRYWICPRHRWRFDLFDAGQCKENSATINAIPLNEI